MICVSPLCPHCLPLCPSFTHSWALAFPPTHQAWPSLPAFALAMPPPAWLTPLSRPNSASPSRLLPPQSFFLGPAGYSYWLLALKCSPLFLFLPSCHLRDSSAQADLCVHCGYHIAQCLECAWHMVDVCVEYL